MADQKKATPTPIQGNYVTTNRFYVEMGGEIKASFSECSGLSVTIDKDVYLEGGVNDQQRIFLKQTKFGDITLKRGMSDDIVFWEWMDMIFQRSQGKTPTNDTNPQAAPALRRNLAILVFNQAGETMQSWILIGAVPVAWKTPSLQASGKNVAIEELVLAYEGLKVEKRPSGNPKGINSGTRHQQSGYFD